MTCPLCKRSDLHIWLVVLLAVLCVFGYFRLETSRESMRIDLEGKIREAEGKQASLVLNGATYAVVHHHAKGEWVATPEPIVTEPKKENSKIPRKQGG